MAWFKHSNTTWENDQFQILRVPGGWYRLARFEWSEKEGYHRPTKTMGYFKSFKEAQARAKELAD